MPINPLRDRINSLPLIIAGPILRRTEANSVTVWVALKNAATLTLNIYEGGRVTPSKLKLTGNTSTVQMGNYLHIAAVTASGGSALQPHQLYCYDMLFQNSSGQKDLAAPGVFHADGISNSTNNVGLCYDGYERPTFVLPSTELSDLRIIHGSCRKPHGGQDDALAYLDKLIEDSHNKVGTRQDIVAQGGGEPRPHQCYFTGDQIYADDVAAPLLMLLDNAGKDLFGWVELLYGAGTPEGVTDALPDVIKPGKREKIITEVANLTAYSKGTSHLMRMSEFFSMYLFAWSDILWPTSISASGATVVDLPAFPDVYPNEAATHTQIIGQTGESNVYKTPLGKSYDDEIAALTSFYSTLGKVRRALANIPSYMMCDDHEITDDWFLNLQWVEKAYASSLGPRIIQNGIAAFSVFQAWGNTPARFNANTPGGELLAKLQQLHNAQGDAMSVLWQGIGNIILPKISYDGIGPNRTPMKSLENNFGIDYYFSIVFEKFILIALDSRNQRAFTDIESPAKDPALLSYSALTNQIVAPLSSLPASVEVALVLCPAPMFGHSIVEGVVQETLIKIVDAPLHPLSTKTTDGRNVAGNEEFDKESWAFNEDGMQGALREFSKYKRVVFFSGDVHYGFTAGVDYHRPVISNPSGTGLPARAHFTQLVCSSLKNQDAKTRSAGSAASRAMPLLDRATMNYAGWGLTVPDPHVMQFDKRGVIDRPIHSHEAPVVIRMTGDRYYKDAQNDSPQWTYSLKFALDKRAKSVRFPSAPPSTAVTNQLDKVKQTNQEYTRYGRNSVAVGEDQIGDVTFTWGTLDKLVNHRFWYKSHGDASQLDPHPHTIHAVDIPSF